VPLRQLLGRTEVEVAEAEHLGLDGVLEGDRLDVGGDAAGVVGAGEVGGGVRVSVAVAVAVGGGTGLERAGNDEFVDHDVGHGGSGVEAGTRSAARQGSRPD
jgi:hypothetical protein